MVVGGWGRDIGDEGSGYSIGIMAINRALKELDSGKQDLSILTKELLPFKTPFNFKDISEYAQKRDFARSCLPKTRQEIAVIAKTVANCAEKGCQLSQEILKENGKEIAKWIELLAKRLEVENPKVVINGGITNTKKFWEEEIRGVREVIFTNDGIDFALKNIVERL